MIVRRFSSASLPFFIALAFAVFAFSARSQSPATRATSPRSPFGTPPRALLVGGGPTPDANPVALESNLRYLHRLLGVTRAGNPKNAITLFADGSAKAQTVLYDAPYASRGDELLGWLLNSRVDASGGSFLRARNLDACDGASTKRDFSRAVARLAATPDARRLLLLYFTGHGGNDGGDHTDNHFILWRDSELSVRELAAQMRRLPRSQRIALVMVQCYSGAFANVLFENGDPKSAPISRDFAGFFASTSDRVAAGCTSEVDEREYHDFTSYFFAALSGRDRVGRVVNTADYDKSGRVGMDEAFAYALIHDESIDVPVRTLDAFARRYAATPDDRVFATPYERVRTWADPAQRAALDALSARLKLSGEDRLKRAYREVTRAVADAGDEENASLNASYNLARAQIVARFPGLKASGEATRKVAERAAVKFLDAQLQAPNANRWRALLNEGDAESRRQSASEKAEIATSRLMRLVRLAKTIVLTHELQTRGAPNVRARLNALLQSERRPMNFVG